MGQRSSAIEAKHRRFGLAALRPQEPLELVGVQPVPAHHGTVEEQDGDVQAITAGQFRIGIDVHDADGGKRDPASQGLELGHHLIAQIAVLPVYHRQVGLGWPILGWHFNDAAGR